MADGLCASLAGVVLDEILSIDDDSIFLSAASCYIIWEEIEKCTSSKYNTTVFSRPNSRLIFD